MNTRGYCPRQTNKLNTCNYLCDIPETELETNLVEVQFKNTRKGYYTNSNNLPIQKGDTVTVEANPGHDVGTVTMTGKLVHLQMQRAHIRPDTTTPRIYRKSRPVDIQKYNESKAKEQNTMIRARKIAQELGLQMKIGDVEYQADGTKAIFYYIADERVDFRQLIKDMAAEFNIKIEMKQIGARQEAARIGSIGPCGREICCSGWATTLNSVSTSAARTQDISTNPQKLSGQCAKLKCCLNYEIDAYTEATKNFPPPETPLHTLDNTYHHFKTDVFKNTITYSTDQNIAANTIDITPQRANEIINMNNNGQKPKTLQPDNQPPTPETQYTDILNKNNITRFDKTKNKHHKHKQKPANPNPDNKPK
jgi:cell fate regulator YaaT (PSP1 superfamily)